MQVNTRERQSNNMKNTIIYMGLAAAAMWQTAAVFSMICLTWMIASHTGILTAFPGSIFPVLIVGSHLGLWTMGIYTQRTEQIN